MVKFLAKNKKQATNIARDKDYYITSVSLASDQKGVGNKKRWTAAKKFW
jgi:hypothetical protein